MTKASLALLLVAAPALACSELNTPVYFNGPGLLELQGTEDPPRLTNGLTLRFRQPNQQERMALDQQRDALGFDVPWVSRDKVHVEVLFTVKNLDSEPGTFDVTADGASEFVKYDSTYVAMAAGDDEPQYFPLLSLHPSLPAVLEPGKTYQGVLREDDFNEAAVDLDAMGRWAEAGTDPMNPPLQPFPAVLINRSEIIPSGATKPLGMAGVPDNVITPALMEIDLTFTATKHMTCEWTVRVRDDEDRLWHVEGDPRFEPTPALFAPAVMP